MAYFTGVGCYIKLLLVPRRFSQKTPVLIKFNIEFGCLACLLCKLLNIGPYGENFLNTWPTIKYLLAPHKT